LSGKISFIWAKKNIKAGNRGLTLSVAIAYLNGIGVKKNYKKSLKWLKKAVKFKIPGAYHVMGLFYEHGIELEQNFKKAFSYYKKEAKSNEVNSIFSLGYYYYKGLEVEQNHKKAFHLFNLAKKRGHIDSYYYLGLYYFNKEYGKQNYKKAIHCFKQSLKSDVFKINAMGLLADCYYKGLGTTIDYEKALEYYIQIQNENNIELMLKIADCYFHVKTPEYYKKAVEIYEKYTTKKYPSSLFNLGICYYEGLGINKDFDKAAECFLIAVYKGNEDSMFYLALMYENGQGVQKNYMKAFQLYSKLTQNTTAIRKMAEFYKYGYGVEMNIEKSNYWLNKAEELEILLQL